MKRKNLIIISVVGIIIVLLSLLGITYGFFATRVVGNTNDKTVYLETSTLRLDYDDNDSYIIKDNIYPTFKSTKTFEVTNTGDVVLDYDVYIENVINTFINTDELTIKITCTSNIDGNTCNGYDNSFPTKNKKLLTNNIEINEKHTYELEFEYIDNGENQSIDMGKVIQGRIQISNPNDVVTLKGNISGYDDSYYIEIVNISTGKSVTSEIVNGQYVLTSIFPGENIVYIKDSTGSTVVSNTLNIRRNSIANINSSATVINTMEESEWVLINMTISDDKSTLSFEGVGVSVTEPMTLKEKILADNNGGFSDSVQSLYVSNTTGIDFSQPGSSTNGQGLYYTNVNTEDNKTTYYYRGDINNNYVQFNVYNEGSACMYNGQFVYTGSGDYKQIVTDETMCTANKVCDYNMVPGYTIDYTEDECLAMADNGATFMNEYASMQTTDIPTEFLWRIVRINEDGSVRLILSKGPMDTLQLSNFYQLSGHNMKIGYMYGLDTTSVSIGSGSCLKYDSSSNSAVIDSTYTTQSSCESAGYKWVATEYDATHANIVDSEAKTILDGWYETYMLLRNDDITDSGFCNDRSLYDGLGYGYEYTYYGAFNRITNLSKPQYKCPQTNDLFTTNDSTFGNKVLTYPIGLLSIDEVIRADTAILPINYSDTNYYYTMSPSNIVVNDIFIYDISGGSFHLRGDELPIKLLPVINIDGNLIVESGSGSSFEPYLISK